jgi:hypothetical protein
MSERVINPKEPLDAAPVRVSEANTIAGSRDKRHKKKNPLAKGLTLTRG